VASQTPQQISNATSKDLFRLRNDPKRKKTTAMNKDDPLNIIRNVVKGFDIAYPKDAYRGEESTTSIRGAAITDAEARAWSTPKHPNKPELQLLDSYPVLPDLDALPTTAYYTVAKFITNPVGASDHYDSRLDAAILRPIDDPQVQANYQRKLAEWDQNSSKLQPLPEYDYDYYLPDEPKAVRGMKRKFDVNDPENDDAELYTDETQEGQRGFKFTRLRTYETYNQHGDANNFYNDSVAVALHDPESDVGVVPGTKKRLDKAAYFYPIIQRTALRPKRNIRRMAVSQINEDRIDELNLTIGDLAEDDRARQSEQRSKLDPSVRSDRPTAVEAAAG